MTDREVRNVVIALAAGFLVVGAWMGVLVLLLWLANP